MGTVDYERRALGFRCWVIEMVLVTLWLSAKRRWRKGCLGILDKSSKELVPFLKLKLLSVG